MKCLLICAVILNKNVTVNYKSNANKYILSILNTIDLNSVLLEII